jgi:hypothetical protein
MKKIYLKPATEIVAVVEENELLALSFTEEGGSGQLNNEEAITESYSRLLMIEWASN